MNEFQEFSHTGTPGTPRWVGLAVGVLCALSLIGLGLGWSALNHDEIDQLRRIGQRDYFEFTVQRKGSATKVGSIQLVLKDTNPKKNQYTMNVLADDNSFEKKNRSVNEPIFFYTGGGRSALELVVNKVTKAGATGYLSIPKGAPTATASVATSGQ